MTIVSIGDTWTTAPNIPDKNKTWTGQLAKQLECDYQIFKWDTEINDLLPNTLIFNAAIESIDSWITTNNSEDLVLIVVWNWIQNSEEIIKTKIPLIDKHISDYYYFDYFYKKLITLYEYCNIHNVKIVCVSARGLHGINTIYSIPNDKIHEFYGLQTDKWIETYTSWGMLWASFAEAMAVAKIYNGGFDDGWLPNKQSHLEIANYLNKQIRRTADRMNWIL